MRVRKVKRRCEVRGCKNLNTYSITKGNQFGNSILICKDCLREALDAIEAIEAKENEGVVSEQAQETTQTGDIPAADAQVDENAQSDASPAEGGNNVAPEEPEATSDDTPESTPEADPEKGEGDDTVDDVPGDEPEAVIDDTDDTPEEDSEEKVVARVEVPNNVDDLVFKCPKCGKEYKTETGLINHMKKCQAE